jgi:hypothetical protein
MATGQRSGYCAYLASIIFCAIIATCYLEDLPCPEQLAGTARNEVRRDIDNDFPGPAQAVPGGAYAH